MLYVHTVRIYVKYTIVKVVIALMHVLLYTDTTECS